MNFIFETLVFGSKAGIIVMSLLVIMVAFFYLLQHHKKHKDDIAVKNLNEHYKELTQAIKQHIHTEKMLKNELKNEKKERKCRAKKQDPLRKYIYVIDFDGDIKASAVESLREEITTILTVATNKDEVVLRLESSGGMVHAYGLAASQLARLREKQIPLSIFIDKIAASGGYMMACVADQIFAAPFAIVGSIGVVAPVPNFHKLLKKHDIDYNEETAGEFKRTVSLFAEITQDGRQKFRQQLEDTHNLFKEFVHKWRPQVEIEKLANGEHWFGQQALGLKLIDNIITSDDYLLNASANSDILAISFTPHKHWSEKIPLILAKTIEYTSEKILNHIGKQIKQ